MQLNVGGPIAILFFSYCVQLGTPEWVFYLFIYLFIFGIFVYLFKSSLQAMLLKAT